MEKLSFIDKALERAKSLRQNKEKSTPPLNWESPASDLPPLRTTRFIGPAAGSTDVDYTLTRTVSVDMEFLHKNRLIFGQEDSALSEGYKMLRTHILQRTKGQQGNVLMITGPLPGEGKTLTAINLAISISQEVNKTALLIDADLRSPRIHRYFGLKVNLGLADHLKTGVPLTEILIHPNGLGKLVLLPAGRATAQASELINSSLMHDLVQELKHFYPDRFVLFDFPPLLSYADALAFAPLVDGIILVVEAGKTPRGDIDRCLKMLKEFPVLGLVLNKVDAPPQSNYYYQNGVPDTPKRKFLWFK